MWALLATVVVASLDAKIKFVIEAEPAEERQEAGMKDEGDETTTSTATGFVEKTEEMSGVGMMSFASKDGTRVVTVRASAATDCPTGGGGSSVDTCTGLSQAVCENSRVSLQQVTSPSRMQTVDTGYDWRRFYMVACKFDGSCSDGEGFVCESTSAAAHRVTDSCGLADCSSCQDVRDNGWCTCSACASSCDVECGESRAFAYGAQNMYGDVTIKPARDFAAMLPSTASTTVADETTCDGYQVGKTIVPSCKYSVECPAASYEKRDGFGPTTGNVIFTTCVLSDGVCTNYGSVHMFPEETCTPSTSSAGSGGAILPSFDRVAEVSVTVAVSAQHPGAADAGEGYKTLDCSGALDDAYMGDNPEGCRCDPMGPCSSAWSSLPLANTALADSCKGTATETECRQQCDENTECNGYTHYASSNWCQLFPACETIVKTTGDGTPHQRRGVSRVTDPDATYRTYAQIRQQTQDGSTLAGPFEDAERSNTPVASSGGASPPA